MTSRQATPSPAKPTNKLSPTAQCGMVRRQAFKPSHGIACNGVRVFVRRATASAMLTMGIRATDKYASTPRFTLIIVTALSIRDNPIRRMPVTAHLAAFGTILFTTSYIPLDALSHGGFTRSASIGRHPGWSQFPSALAPLAPFLLQRRNTDPQRKAAEASP
jgi:hypothetical protein